MKKLLFITIASIVVTILLSSCAGIKYEESRYLLDFRPYTAEGFTITPMPVINESDECIALVAIEAKEGRETISSSGVTVIGGMGSVETDATNNVTITSADMLEKLVAYAKSIGATGIVDIKCDRNIEYVNKIPRDTYYISGCAVRQKTNSCHGTESRQNQLKKVLY